MKNTRLVHLLVFFFVLAPFLNMGLGMCSMCDDEEMEMAMDKAMPPCHTASAPAEKGELLKLTSTCCCALLSCAELNTSDRTALPVEGVTTPALGLVIQVAFKGFTAPIVRPLRPTRSASLRTTAIPIYQLNSSFLI